MSQTAMQPNPSFGSPDEVVSTLGSRDYVAGDALAMSVFLALKMGRPLFLEGAPGVGKTLLARVLATVFDTRLIRLQCFEGLDSPRRPTSGTIRDSCWRCRQGA